VTRRHVPDRWRDRLQARVTAARDDRGATVVEFAVMLPVLALLTLGLLDGGLMLFTFNAVSNASREGARTVVEQPGDDFADYYALRAVSVVTGSVAAENIEQIVIYRATPDTDGDRNPLDNPPPASCLSGTGVTGVCNVYTGADLLVDKATYTVGQKYTSWPGTSRDVWADANDVDYIGVYVAARFRPPTGMLGGDRTISRYTVIRVEPQSTNPVQ
jgi:Flp pilus assembly protein TadG